jgi:hypothetical protein
LFRVANSKNYNGRHQYEYTDTVDSGDRVRAYPWESFSITTDSRCYSYISAVEVIRNRLIMCMKQVDGFREFLKQREAVHVTLEKAEREKIKLQEERVRSSSSAAPTTSNRLSLKMFQKSPEDLVRFLSVCRVHNCPCHYDC